MTLTIALALSKGPSVSLAEGIAADLKAAGIGATLTLAAPDGRKRTWTVNGGSDGITEDGSRIEVGFLTERERDRCRYSHPSLRPKAGSKRQGRRAQ